MGILLLPSLEEKRHIILDGVSQTEAEMFITDFTNRVKASRRLSTPKKHIDDEFKIYNLIENVADWDVHEIFEELVESDVPRHRGSRAVFIDEDTDTIIVGTTVVYSANWAMVGFDDETVETTILSFQ